MYHHLLADLSFRLSFSKAVNLDNTSDVVISTPIARATSLEAAASDFHILDIFIALYDKDFAPLGFVVEWLGQLTEEKLTQASPGRLGQDFDLSDRNRPRIVQRWSGWTESW